MNEEKPGGRVRIGDEEREDAVKRLGVHFEAGRLTAEEHTERVGLALEAKTAADLNALFEDLPENADGQAWNGPWGWTKPPWTAAETGAAAGAGSAGGAGSSGPRRPGWAARGPLGRIPVPVLGAVALLLAVACTIGGGHPPILPLLLIVAGVVIYKKRRREQRA